MDDASELEWWRDMSDPADFGHALRWLGARTIDVHVDPADAFDAEWLGVLRRHVTGFTTVLDQKWLERKCEEARARDEEWRAFVTAWSALGEPVSPAELDLLLDTSRQLEIFGSSLLSIPAGARVAVVRGHLNQGSDDGES